MTEQYRLIYDQPIYPKNLYAERPPYDHDSYRREVIEPQMRSCRSAASTPRQGTTKRRRQAMTGDGDGRALTGERRDARAVDRLGSLALVAAAERAGRAPDRFDGRVSRSSRVTTRTARFGRSSWWARRPAPLPLLGLVVSTQVTLRRPHCRQEAAAVALDDRDHRDGLAGKRLGRYGRPADAGHLRRA